MAEEKKVVTLDDFEQRLMVSGLMDFRNDLLRDEKPTEDINDLILKVIDAPTKKEKRRADREARYDIESYSDHAPKDVFERQLSDEMANEAPKAALFQQTEGEASGISIK